MGYFYPAHSVCWTHSKYVIIGGNKQNMNALLHFCDPHCTHLLEDTVLTVYCSFLVIFGLI